MLPRVKISYLNGQLGSVAESPDGLVALVVGSAAVDGKYELGKAYHIRSTDDLETLGLTEENNAQLVKTLKEFYGEADSGTEVVLFGVEPTKTATEVLDYTNKDGARKVIESEGGRLRGVIVANLNTGAKKGETGLDADVSTALAKAQELGDWATETLEAPIFVMLEGRGYAEGKDVPDLSKSRWNRVGVLIGDTVADSDGAAMGVLAGRIAMSPVQRNIGRVKTGALAPVTMYVGSKKAEEATSEIADLYDKGYITPRTHVGRSGYFFTDDRLAVAETDDYAHLALRRVIDKAYRVAYNTMLDELLDEIEVSEDGTMQPAVVKSWEQTVENALSSEMTRNGELCATSSAPEGGVCYIDDKQNVVSTGKVKATIKVNPYGYGRMIDVDLGFNISQGK